MSKIKEIFLSDDSCIYVEMEEADIPESAVKMPKDLPEGAELTSAAEKVRDAMTLLNTTISHTASNIYEGIKKSRPDEWTMELNIGFKGKTHPIPVILSGGVIVNSCV